MVSSPQAYPHVRLTFLYRIKIRISSFEIVLIPLDLQFAASDLGLAFLNRARIRVAVRARIRIKSGLELKLDLG